MSWFEYLIFTCLLFPCPVSARELDDCIKSIASPRGDANDNLYGFIENDGVNTIGILGLPPLTFDAACKIGADAADPGRGVRLKDTGLPFYMMNALGQADCLTLDTDTSKVIRNTEANFNNFPWVGSHEK